MNSVRITATNYTTNSYTTNLYFNKQAIGGASQHNSMPVPGSYKRGGKPENPA